MIRPAVFADFPAILALNEESVHFTSPMDLRGLERLHGQSAYHRVVEFDGKVVAFLLALREGQDYGSPNYVWFTENYPTFLYVDRVVVSFSQQGKRLGSLLYEDLIAFARETCMDKITCEYDVEPPNEGSRRFHDAFGFAEVGSHWVADGKKRVSLQVASIK